MRGSAAALDSDGRTLFHLDTRSGMFGIVITHRPFYFLDVGDQVHCGMFRMRDVPYGYGWAVGASREIMAVASGMAISG